MAAKAGQVYQGRDEDLFSARSISHEGRIYGINPSAARSFLSAVGGKKIHGGTITINNKAFENGPPDSDKRQLSGGRGKRENK